MRRVTLALVALTLLLTATAPLLALAPAATDAKTGANTDANADTPSPLAMLTGHWRADMGGTILDEYWFPVEHGSTSGVLRWFDKQGDIRMHELLHIGPGAANENESPDSEPALRFEMRHFFKGMKPWEDESEGPYPGAVTFPNPATMRITCTDPAKTVGTITYAMTGDDTMRVTLAYRDDLNAKPIIIDFTRVE